jgi:glycosyltransferase involved in cell wall biosynthesis
MARVVLCPFSLSHVRSICTDERPKDTPVGTSLPYVSVIIPVFNDRERLLRCLDALSRQTYPRDRFEVVVVDNGSAESLEDIQSAFDNVRLECETRVGSYSARNKGLDVANGEVIAFTDSDCLPAPDWIEHGVKRIGDDASVGLLAGRVELFFRDPGHPSSAEIWDLYNSFQQEEHVNKHHFGATANVFTRRDVVEVVGPFDERLKSAGDADWGQRVAGNGFKLVYAEDVIVAHPARDSLAQVCAKTRRIAGGTVDKERGSQFARVRSVRRLGATIVMLPIVPVRVLLDSRVSKLSDRLKLTYVTLRVQLVLIHERARLMLGATSQRT